jgi:phosphatidylserine decarboxylase
MNIFIISIIENTILSFGFFYYLIYKAKIENKYLYVDNLIIIILSTLIGSSIHLLLSDKIVHLIFTNFVLIVFLIIFTILFRFYRDPERQVDARARDILSPADGIIIYVKKVENNEMPLSIKGKTISKLQELTKVEMQNSSCWLIGIVMTLFDVHVNRAPISGRVIMKKHFKGRFFSLKRGEAEVENERNTVVIKNENIQVGVIQIASKRVRGIETYVETGQNVKTGERIGRIKFGSQTDIVFPIEANVNVKVGQRVYGGKTILASISADK